ncbi:MAG: transcriptional regulator [Candidatus Coatesbacteria bacterium]|nr:MAG: transcriptional regulator [Candidatus Coatesbacteria bacterium]
MGTTIKDIAAKLEAEALVGHNINREVGCVIASDLVSDMLVCCDTGAFLITGLANIQVVRAAEMIDLIGVVFVRNKEPAAEVVEYAKKMELPLLSTDYTMYEACALVYDMGLRPGDFSTRED